MILIIIAVAILTSGFFLATYREITATVVQTVGVILLLYAFPKYTSTIITRKYPRFGSLVKGCEPYNKISSLPKRIFAVGVYALFLVALGLGVVVAVYFMVNILR